MSGRLVRFALLVVVWLLVLDSGDPLDVLVGAVVSAAAMALADPGAPARGEGRGTLTRLAGVPRFVVGTLIDVTRGTWDVALRVSHLRPLGRSGIVEVPVGERTELGIAVDALATTLSPGSVLVDVDRERGVMLIHVIDASDPDRVRAEQADFYERWQRGAFP